MKKNKQWFDRNNERIIAGYPVIDEAWLLLKELAKLMKDETMK